MPFVDAGNKQLEYFERGNGDDVVILVHGAGSSALIWDTVQDLLAQSGFRSIAISLPGAGGSDRTTDLADYNPASYAKDLRAALDSLSIDHFALAGHSLGVSNVLNLAANHSDGLTIRALILMAGGNVIGKAAESPERAKEIIATYNEPDPATDASRRAAWEKLHGGLKKEIQDALWRDIQNNPKERNLGQRLGPRADMTEFVSSCDIPTLIISGDADSVVPLEYTLAMYPTFPANVRHCHVIHGVDHYPNGEVPEEITGVYTRFLKSYQK